MATPRPILPTRAVLHFLKRFFAGLLWTAGRMAALLMRFLGWILRLAASWSPRLLRMIGRALRVAARWSLRLLQKIGRWTNWGLLWTAAHPRRSLDGLVGLLMFVVLTLAVEKDLPSDLALGVSLDCMALNIYHEARGEAIEGQLAVAHVVMNRVTHDRFPGNVCDVIKQGGEWPRNHCQFSWWCDGRSDTPKERGRWTASRELAREILAGRHGDPTGGALWYHATRVSPYWRKDFAEGPTIGNHVFYSVKE